MKKYPYILILAVFLVGCNETSSEEIITSSSINSETPSSQVTSSQTSEDIISSSIASGTSSEEPEVGVWRKKVTFYNGGFTNSSLDQAASQSQFVNWFNGESDPILDSINYEGYAQLNYIGNQNDSWRFSTLILGSQNSNGKITFNLNVHAIAITVVVQAYSKYIAYNDSYSTDTNATFLIDNKEYDLSLEEGHTGDTEKITIDHYSDPVTSFSISNKEAGQRVFVHSMEITYWGY